MNKKRYQMAMILIGINVVLIFLCRGNWWHMLLAIGALPIAGLAFILGVIKICAFTRNKCEWSDVVACFGIAIFSGSIFISLFIGEALEEKDISNAKKYCESIVPRIEQYHSDTGHYPKDLKELGELVSPPRILRYEQPFYFSNTTNYSFSFSRPSAIWFDGWTYSKSKWHHYN